MTNGTERDRPSWGRRLLAEALRHRGLVVAVLLVALLGSGVAAAPPVLLGQGVDLAVAGDVAGIWPIALLIGIAALLVFASSFARQAVSARLALAVQDDLRRDMHRAVQSLDGAAQDAMRTGQVMSRANVDLQLVQGFLTQAVPATGSIVLLAVGFAAMLWCSPALTLIHVVLVGASIVLTVRSTKRLSPATWAAQHRTAVLTQIVTETIAGASVVRAFGQEDREIRRFGEEARRLFAERMRIARMQSPPMATLQSLPLLAQLAVIVLGGLLAIAGQLDVGTLVTFAAFTSVVLAPAGTLSNLVVAAQLTKSAAERVFDLIDTPSSVVEAEDARAVPEGALGLALEGVRFAYGDGAPVLEGLELTVRAGESVAVVGPSGCGKSTLAMLIPRFYDPAAGSVALVADDGSLDLRELELSSLRRSVAVVFDEPRLVAGTMAENIAYGRPGASREEIEVAARAALADGFIDAAGGYDAEVAEGGANLSGGQRQRLALARALLDRPQLLVVDDGLSAVDAESLAAIEESLAEAFSRQTTLVMARSRSTLDLVDRVVVLDGGRIIDEGRPDELEARCEAFKRLFGAGAHAERGPTERDLWPETSDPLAGTGAEVLLDGQPVRREEAEAAQALPAATAAPSERALTLAADERARTRRGLAAMLAPFGGLVALAAVLMGSDALLTSLMPAMLSKAMDDGVAHGDVRVVLVIAAVALVLIGINWFALLWQPRILSRTGESVMLVQRMRSFAKLQRLGLRRFESDRSGSLLTRMTTDITALADFAESGMTIVAVNAITILAMATAMAILDWRLALVAFAVLPVVAVATLIFRSLARAAYSESRDRLGEINAGLQEDLEGVRAAQAAGTTEANKERFGELSGAFHRARLRAQTYQAVYFPFLALLGEVATILVLIVGAGWVADGVATPGALGAFIIYLGLFFAPFQQLAQVFDGYQRASVGALRIAELLSMKPEVVDGPHAEAWADDEPRAGRLEVSGLTFAYEDGSIALEDVSVEIPSGATVAIVGETGSGKSTLLRLIGRFYEFDQGAVELDGRDVRTVPQRSLRARTALVPQELHLFTGTIADNIRYGRPDAGDDEVERAAADAGALEAIARLPLGFRQPAGEGAGLAGGQGQLIALARAKLADPALLLLDEPTSTLDRTEEERVLDALDAPGPTTILVTHRLEGALRADHVVVLRDGRIIERGAPEQLLASRGAFAALVDAERGIHQRTGSSLTP